MSVRPSRPVMSALVAVLAMALVLPAAATGVQAAADAGACVRSTDPTKSVARLWDEALLDAIRRDFPAPTVHARNLYHVSAAMWDAWAAFDPEADGVFVTEKVDHPRPVAARDRAISYAAYRVLSHRYKDAAGAMVSLRAVRRSHGRAVLPGRAHLHQGGLGRGAREPHRQAHHQGRPGGRLTGAEGYYSPDYQPVNEPLVVELPGAVMADPNRWQPLALEVSIAQNGQPLPVGPQEFIGPHWGDVTSFALPPATEAGLPIDPGPPPLLGDPESDRAFKDSAVDVIRYSSLLDPRDGVTEDISPAALGANPLGTYDGSGYDVNPVTGQPYEPNVVPRGGLRPGARRVLGRWPGLRDPARPLEHAGQRRRRHARLRASPRRCRRGAGPARVGRQDVPRAQRRRARRGHRRLGLQGPLRLRPAHLDDPLHGRPGPVERPGRTLLSP